MRFFVEEDGDIIDFWVREIWDLVYYCYLLME